MAGFEEIIRKAGLSAEEREAFEAYTANRFTGAAAPEADGTDFLAPWRSIVIFAGQVGGAEAFNRKVCAKRPVAFRRPETVSIEIYDSFAGEIPVISVPDAADYEDTVTNLVYKGVRPENLSVTGASFLSAKTTRFMILSGKPYSNVPAEELGLEEEQWGEQSLRLRRAHECCHFYTRQRYGLALNLLHDELMADFTGLMDAFGFYRAEWFLRFMGVIPGAGNRLTFYTKDLTERVRAAVGMTAAACAASLEAWSGTEVFRKMSVPERIDVMCAAGLEGILDGLEGGKLSKELLQHE